MVDLILTGRGGPGRGQGRKAKAEDKRRQRCGFMTLPGWMVDWLRDQEQPAGHIVERAIIELYGEELPNVYQKVDLTDDDLARLDDGQEWWQPGDDVSLGGYVSSQQLDLGVNGETHDNWINRDDLPVDIVARLE